MALPAFSATRAFNSADHLTTAHEDAFPRCRKVKSAGIAPTPLPDREIVSYCLLLTLRKGPRMQGTAAKATGYVWKKTVMAALTCAAISLFPQSLAAESASVKSKMPGIGLYATPLARHYASMQESLVSSGYLRQDRAPASMALTPARLAHNFFEIAMRHEYGASGSQPMMRWEVPVRYSVAFGASVSDAQRARDKQAIGSYFNHLSGVARHPIAPVARDANFHILVVSDGERRGIGQFLKTNVEGISNASVNRILRMQPNHLCMVISVPHADRTKGYRSAVAIIRAEHTDRMRTSCIQEELAQGMGLPNDCKTAQHSIFNDNERYGVLTKHDEALLKMLYDPALRSGMRQPEVERHMPRLATSALR